MDPVRHDLEPVAPSEFVWRPRPKFQDRVWLHVLLFVLTIVTTTLAGGSPLRRVRRPTSARDRESAGALLVLLHGLWYSGTILAILGCHELGHYFACRYYDVDASLPFFLPLPPPFPTGTLGAFIRIREPIPTKRMLFDIGIAGPIAGFLVAVPALFIGLAMSHVVRDPAGLRRVLAGRAAAVQGRDHGCSSGTPPDGYSHQPAPDGVCRLVRAAGDGAEPVPDRSARWRTISYAVLGRRSSHVTLAMVVAAIVLTYFSSSWMVWTTLMIGMLFLFGRHHPRTFDEDEPLDRQRDAARARRAHHLDPLLHAGADRAARSSSSDEARC